MGLEEIRKLKAEAGLPKPKKIYRIPKQSNKKIKEIAEAKKSGSDNEMDAFFQAMRKRLKGKCLFCNSGTTWKNEELWRIAIAHLLPKSKFKSIGTNENNWVELCWNCHTDFDSSKITWLMLKDSLEWNILKEKLLTILPLVAEEERKNKLYSKLNDLVYAK